MRQIYFGYKLLILAISAVIVLHECKIPETTHIYTKLALWSEL